MSLEANQPGWDPPAVLATRRLTRAERWADRPAPQRRHGGLAWRLRQGRRRRGRPRAGGVAVCRRGVGGSGPDGAATRRCAVGAAGSQSGSSTPHGSASLFLRSMGMQGADQMVDDSPPMALCFKEWATADRASPRAARGPQGVASRLRYRPATGDLVCGSGPTSRGWNQGPSAEAVHAGVSDPLSSMTGRKLCAPSPRHRPSSKPSNGPTLEAGAATPGGRGPVPAPTGPSGTHAGHRQRPWTRSPDRDAAVR